MKKIFAALVLFVGTLATAQNASIGATVTDSDGQSWNNGTYQIYFVPPSGYTGTNYSFNGTPWTPPTPINGSLSDSGTFSYSPLPRNDYILPSGSGWAFKMCPVASAPCSTTTLVINQSTQNLSSSLVIVAPRFAASNVVLGSYGYNDTEVLPTNPPIGNFYWNVSLLQQRYWDGTEFISQQFTYPGAGVVNSTGSAWGASYTVGIGNNDLVQLNGSAQLPAVSGANLTNLPVESLTTTGSSGAATLSGGVLNIPQYLGGVGSGTPNNVAMFTGASTVGNSSIVDNGTDVSTSELLQPNGGIAVDGTLSTNTLVNPIDPSGWGADCIKSANNGLWTVQSNQNLYALPGGFNSYPNMLFTGEQGLETGCDLSLTIQNTLPMQTNNCGVHTYSGGNLTFTCASSAVNPVPIGGAAILFRGFTGDLAPMNANTVITPYTGVYLATYISPTQFEIATDVVTSSGTDNTGNINMWPFAEDFGAIDGYGQVDMAMGGDFGYHLEFVSQSPLTSTGQASFQVSPNWPGIDLLNVPFVVDFYNGWTYGAHNTYDDGAGNMNIAPIWSNSGTNYNGLGIDITDTGHGSDSSAFWVALNSSTLFSISPTGLVGLPSSGAIQISGATSGSYIKADGTGYGTPGSSITFPTGLLYGNSSTSAPTVATSSQVQTTIGAGVYDASGAAAARAAVGSCTNQVVTADTTSGPTCSVVAATDFGTQSANTVLAGPSSGSAATPTFRSLSSADIPNNAANTTGSAGSLASYPTLCSGSQFSQGLSSGSNNCATPSGSTPNALTMNNSGSGAASGATFDGSAAKTISYNTIGAQPSLSLIAGTYVNGDYCTYASSGTLLNCNSTPGTGLSGMTATQVPIAATASTITSSMPLAGAGSGIVTGPTTSTANDAVTMNGTNGQVKDAGFAPASALACTTVSSLSPANGGCYNLSTSASVAMPAASAFTIFTVNTQSGATATFTSTTLTADAGCQNYISGSTLAVTGNQTITVQSDGTNVWAKCSGYIPPQYKTWSCQPGIGDGYDDLGTETYAIMECWNTTGVAVTINAISCYTDHGTSTLQVADYNGTTDVGNILSSAVTCASPAAAGTISGGTYSLANGHNLQFTYDVTAADGTQATWIVGGTY